MYFSEHDDQPEAFSSIPATMWWSVVTLTTVGYGDAFPVTALGKTIAAIIAILGIGMFALPAGLLGAGFAEELEKRRRSDDDSDEPRRCRHCGELFDEH
jgi:voltage-gated potassium channel